MPTTLPTRFRPLLLAFALGLLAALLCQLLHGPLPWLVGPLFATAGARMAGIDLFSPVQVRQAGQLVVGTALGLYFTPPVLKTLVSYLGYIGGGVLFAMLLGGLCGRVLQRLSGVDATTAFFAMAVGGASEMAVQGERHGAAVDRVAAAHSLRVLMVVGIVPFCFKFAGIHGVDLYVPGTRFVHYGGLLLLTLLATGGGLALQRLNLPNAWMIGPLLVTTGLTAFQVHLSALPEWSVHLGQLLIGISLGTRFSPEFLHTAPRYMLGVALSSALALLLTFLFGLGLALVSGIHPATAILATAPGGIAEMSLTAKNLQLGVPVVTAFHVTRLITLVLTIGPLFRLLQTRRALAGG